MSTSRKRKNLKLTEPPYKKPKSESRDPMSPFETPHPSLEAQSQVYKLPSSQPRCSPGPLSPLPIAPVVVSSKKFKENRSSVGSTPWSKHSSTTLRSAALTSGPRSENERGSHSHSTNFRRRKSNRSRSVSRSSSQSNSNPSSRACSKEPTHHPKSQLKHTVSLSALDPLKDNPESKPKPQHKPKKQKSTAQPLASPFVSRASSPVAAHIPTSDANQHRDVKVMGTPPVPLINLKRREALTEAFYPNLPMESQPTSRSRSHHHKSQVGISQSAGPSPERGSDNGGARKAPKSHHGSNVDHRENAKRRHTRGEENSNFPKRDLSQKQKKDRERRPSAPSSFLRPRPRPLPFRVSVPVGNDEAPNSNANTKKLRLVASGLDVVSLPNNNPTNHFALQQITNAKLEPAVDSTSSTNTQAVIPHLAPIDRQKRQPNFKDEDSDPGMAWMHTRSGVDFNRPPSQMEFLDHPGGFGPYGFGMGLDDPFLASDDDKASSDEAEAAGRGTAGKGPGPGPDFRLHLQEGLEGRLDLDEKKFGEDAWGISTPHKDDNVQDEAKKQKAKLDLKIPGQVVQSQQDKRGQGLAKRANPQPALGLAFLSASSSSLGLGSGFIFSPAARSVPSKSELVLKANDDQENKEEVKQDEYEDESSDDGSGEDMDLTASATFGYLEANVAGAKHQHQSLGEEDMTPWITDSLISPPTVFLERKQNDGQLGAGEIKPGEDEQEGKTATLIEVTSNREHEFEDQGVEVVVEKQFIQDGGTTTTGGTGIVNTASSKGSTSRTRSGTIVPANPMPPGARRTRSGTIVGPLAAPSAPAYVAPSNKVFIGSTRRTRSGTIVAASSSTTGTQAPGDNGPEFRPERIGRARSSSMLKLKDRQQTQPRNSPNPENDSADRIKPTTSKATLAHHTSSTYSMGRSNSTNDPEFEFDADSESDFVEVECFADSLYVPRLGSSPDPIDFLRFASIEEDDDEAECLPMEFAPGGEREVSEMKWCVAEEPPSPELVRKRGSGGRFGLRGRGKLGGKGRTKATKNLKARFVGISAEEEADAEEERPRKAKQTDVDDELLLLPGETAGLWI